MAATFMGAVLAGCGGSTDDAPASASVPGEITVPVSAATVELVDAGAEPRSPISYTLSPGTTQRTTFTSEAKVSQQIDIQNVQDFSSPEITLTLDSQIRDNTDDAEAAIVDFTIADASSPNEPLNSALENSHGSGAGLTIQPNGSVTALRLRPADAATDLARSAIEQALHQSVYRTVVFPTQPVGIGAQWTVRQQVVSGIALEQTMTVTLVERDGDRVTVEYTLTQAPKTDTWVLPQEAGTLQIKQYETVGTGRAVVDLGQPLPLDGDASIAGEQLYTDPDGVAALRQTTNNTVRWENK
ncbi:MAG: hypothetical protein GX542_05910 [Rhodococcus sp.]|nr:hypothetical protein [Rhodococcus sp. (in: high G+C Gram-positive bacteria)]